MRTLNVFLCCSPLIFAIPADAHEAGTGETCNPVEHNIAHTINTKDYSCDKTVCTKCNTSGGTVSGCTKTTYWENCTPAAVRVSPPNLRPPAAGGVIREPSAPSTKGTPPPGCRVQRDRRKDNNPRRAERSMAPTNVITLTASKPLRCARQAGGRARRNTRAAPRRTKAAGSGAVIRGAQLFDANLVRYAAAR